MGQVGVLGIEDLARAGVVAVAGLLALLLMALTTIQRRHQRGDGGIVVFEGIGVSRLGPVAIQAGDPGFAVGGALPLAVDAGLVLTMASLAAIGYGIGQGRGDKQTREGQSEEHGSAGKHDLGSPSGELSAARSIPRAESTNGEFLNSDKLVQFGSVIS
jgi:hypothetical protein